MITAINKITVIMVLAGTTGGHQSAHRPQGNRAFFLKLTVLLSAHGSASRLATAAGLNPVELRPWAFDSPRFRSMATT